MSNDNLQTPKYIIDALGYFDMDPCAGHNTSIGRVNLCDTLGDDGLLEKWEGVVYVNPPFSQKEKWIAKMIEHRKGILLLPERGSAPWFGPLAQSCGRYFVMGRKINFIGGSSSNNVGSVLFPFGDIALEKIYCSRLPGHMVTVEFFNERQK